MIFATAVFEPALYLPDEGSAADASGRGWGDRATVIRALDARLSGSDWLVGDGFTAADVMLGSLLSIALFNRPVPAPPASLTAYADRLMERAAFKTAAFGSGVNVTLGLPVPRTSPDHGTALDIAGKGIADAGSMKVCPD